MSFSTKVMRVSLTTMAAHELYETTAHKANGTIFVWAAIDRIPLPRVISDARTLRQKIVKGHEIIAQLRDTEVSNYHRQRLDKTNISVLLIEPGTSDDELDRIVLLYT